MTLSLTKDKTNLSDYNLYTLTETVTIFMDKAILVMIIWFIQQIKLIYHFTNSRHYKGHRGLPRIIIILRRE